MDRDFTHRSYRELLAALAAGNYRFLAFGEMAGRGDGSPRVVLRHDVDRLPSRAVAMAILESECGVRATYFFRVRGGAFAEQAVRRVAGLSHEIGYHYEELADTRGDTRSAWDLFRRNLDRLRAVAPVESIAMHGRPLSRWDARDLWGQYDYRSVGVQREAYLDVDWTRWRYFTDTGRAWNGSSNLRDFPLAEGALPLLRMDSTGALARYLRADRPDVVISNHPERWAAGMIGWMQVLATDTAVSLAKRALKPRRNDAPAPV